MSNRPYPTACSNYTLAQITLPGKGTLRPYIFVTNGMTNMTTDRITRGLKQGLSVAVVPKGFAFYNCDVTKSKMPGVLANRPVPKCPGYRLVVLITFSLFVLVLLQSYGYASYYKVVSAQQSPESAPRFNYKTAGFSAGTATQYQQPGLSLNDTVTELHEKEENVGRVIIRLNKENKAPLPSDASLPYGNLTRINSFRASLFDRTLIPQSAHLDFNLSDEYVHNLTIVTAGGVPLPPYVVGEPLARKAQAKGVDLELECTEGFVYNQAKFARISGYTLVSPSTLDTFRHAQLARLPSDCTDADKTPWLLEFRNVWLTGKGDIYEPVSKSSSNRWRVRAYSYGGGFVIEHWSKRKGRRFRIPASRHCQSTAPVVFALTQNHGYSYFHVIDEQLPRLFAFWDVALAVLGSPSGQIVIPKSSVLKSVFSALGVPHSRVKHLSGNWPCFFERVLVPAPFLQGQYAHGCSRIAAAKILQHAVAYGPVPEPLPQLLEARRAINHNTTEQPLVVLVERATRRSGSRCNAIRCLSNFVALQKAIKAEFGFRIRLVVLRPRAKELLRRSIALFSNATVVVGAHGAAFANVIHMRSRGSYALHLGWRSVGFYAWTARNRGVEHVNIVTKGLSQHGYNAVANVTVVISEIRRVLLKEGYPLDPPKIAIDPESYQNLIVTLSKDG